MTNSSFFRKSLPLLLVALSAVSHAQLVDAKYDADGSNSNFVADGNISANEYGLGNSQSFLGAGTGFGGTLGNGAMYMDFSSTNLNIGAALGNNLNDNIVILIDSKAGGFTDAQMNDTGDPGRNLSTNLTRDVDDQFFSTFLPDYSIVIGSFGIVSFELTSGSLNFIDYNGTFTGNAAGLAREYTIGQSAFSINTSQGFDFIVGYGSDTNYMSNEGIPGQGFASGGNLGFDNNGNGTVHWDHYDHFGVVPEPASMVALSFGLVAMLKKRRK